MDCLPKKSGRCGEVVFSGGSTVFLQYFPLYLAVAHIRLRCQELTTKS